MIIDDRYRRDPGCICEDDDEDPQMLIDTPGCPVHDPDPAVVTG